MSIKMPSAYDPACNKGTGQFSCRNSPSKPNKLCICFCWQMWQQQRCGWDQARLMLRSKCFPESLDRERSFSICLMTEKKGEDETTRLHYSNLSLSQAGALCHEGDYPCLSIQTLPPARWLIYPHFTDSDYIATSELLWNLMTNPFVSAYV